jgi:hypothetical protein
MTKTQKEVLAEIENGGVHAASDWAFTAAMGTWTKEKWERRIYAVLDLAKQGKIVDHETSAYHALNVTCVDCD